MKRIQIEVEFHGLRNDRSIPVLVRTLVKGVAKLESVFASSIPYDFVLKGRVGLGRQNRFSQEVGGCDHFAESLYPNCRFGSISGYLDGTVVTLHEGMAILEDKEKVAVKFTVGGVGLVSDTLEVVTKTMR